MLNKLALLDGWFGNAQDLQLFSDFILALTVLKHSLRPLIYMKLDKINMPELRRMMTVFNALQQNDKIRLIY